MVMEEQASLQERAERHGALLHAEIKAWGTIKNLWSLHNFVCVSAKLTDGGWGDGGKRDDLRGRKRER